MVMPGPAMVSGVIQDPAESEALVARAEVGSTVAFRSGPAAFPVCASGLQPFVPLE
jgi:hypothetical protein